MNSESANERARFARRVAFAFILLTVPRLLLHELWRDEAWLWQATTESRTVSELFSSLSRVGHGYLFPLLCYLASQLSTSPRMLQLLHLVVACAACYSIARWAPFDRTERMLLAFGYFPFYEYAVISRNYALGALLLWLACAATRSRHAAIWLGAAIGLLCQTTVYGFILAIAIGAGWMIDRRARGEPLPFADALAGLSLALTGAIAGVIQLMPLPDTTFASHWRSGWDPAHALKSLQTPWRGMVPLPRFELHFWNSNLLDPWPGLQAIAGVLTLGVAIAVLWRRKVALVSFAIGGLGLLSFGYIKLVGELRHQGHWWLLFIATLWLAGGFAREDGRPSWRRALLRTLLVLHCGVMVFASVMDLRHPFSNGARAAELIRARGLDGYPLLGYREPPVSPVALALGRPLYAPSRGVFATRPDWSPRQRDLSPSELRCAARGLAQRHGKDVVLVMNRELPRWPELDPAGSVHGAIVQSEDYDIYLLRVARLPGTADEAACREGPP